MLSIFDLPKFFRSQKAACHILHHYIELIAPLFLYNLVDLSYTRVVLKVRKMKYEFFLDVVFFPIVEIYHRGCHIPKLVQTDNFNGLEVKKVKLVTK